MAKEERLALISGRGTQWIVFRLAETEFVVRSVQIMQIEMVEKITPVPNAPAFVRGVAYLRGEVVPILDLRLRLGLPALETGMASRILVVGSDARRVGLLVDSAREVVYLDEAALQPPPEATTAGGASHVVGVAVQDGRMLLVLDVEKVINAGIDLAPADVAGTGEERPGEGGEAPPDTVEQGGEGRATVQEKPGPPTPGQSRSRGRKR